jgi:hypothetical protein
MLLRDALKVRSRGFKSSSSSKNETNSKIDVFSGVKFWFTYSDTPIWTTTQCDGIYLGCVGKPQCLISQNVNNHLFRAIVRKVHQFRTMKHGCAIWIKFQDLNDKIIPKTHPQLCISGVHYEYMFQFQPWTAQVQLDSCGSILNDHSLDYSFQIWSLLTPFAVMQPRHLPGIANVWERSG